MTDEQSQKRPDFWITSNGGMFYVTDRAGIFTQDRSFGDYWRAETYVLGCLTWHAGNHLEGAKMLGLTDCDRWWGRPEAWMPGHIGAFVSRGSAYP